MTSNASPSHLVLGWFLHFCPGWSALLSQVSVVDCSCFCDHCHPLGQLGSLEPPLASMFPGRTKQAFMATVMTQRDNFTPPYITLFGNPVLLSVSTPQQGQGVELCEAHGLQLMLEV